MQAPICMRLVGFHGGTDCAACGLLRLICQDVAHLGVEAITYPVNAEILSVDPLQHSSK
jgi:hypothetical protein